MPEPRHDGDAALECPRCSTKAARIVARSPVPDVWTMHLCPVCFYSWRSTEPDYATKATALAPRFRIDPDRLEEGASVPGVPPLLGAG